MSSPRWIPAVLAAVALPSLASTATAVMVPPGFVVESAVSGGAFTVPTGLAFLPDGRMIVIEKEGSAWMVKNGVRHPTPVWSRPAEVLDFSDRGLLGVAVDPAFPTNRRVYFLYTVDPDSNGVDDDALAFGRLTRYTMRTSGDTNTVDPASRTILMGVDWRRGKLDAGTSHSIGALRWGRDGSLLVSTGEGAEFVTLDPGGLHPAAFGPTRTDPNEDIGAFRAQDITNICGKILRIDPGTGHGYPSNPFVDGDLASARSRVWAYGLRNPFRFGVRPGTGSTDPAAGQPGALYIGEVGWGTWEEMNVASQPGQNFGWPCMEGFNPHNGYQAATPAHNGCGSVGTPTNPSAWRPPASVWHHASPELSVPPGETGVASVGGAFYADTLYPGAYRGRYFFADYGANWIRVATFSPTHSLIGVADFGTGMNAPVDLQRHPLTGDIHYVSITTGEVRRIRWTGAVGGNAAPVARAVALPASGPAPLTVQFSGADSFDPEGDPMAYAWDFGDGGSSGQRDPVHVYAGTGTFNATLTVSDGRGGSSQSVVTVTVGPSGAFPTAGVLDRFDRPDGPLAAPWLGTTGMAIADSALVQTCCYATPVWGGAAFGPDQEAYVTLAAIAPGAPEHDLMLKVQGTGYAAAHIEVRYDDSVPQVTIATYDPAVGWRDRGAVSVAFVAGDQLGARARADGTVEVFKNGVKLGEASVAAWAYFAAGGRIGLTLDQAFQSRLDDFGGGDWVPVSASPVVAVQSPNGGESWVGGASHPIQWTATDDVAVTRVDVYFRDGAGRPWIPLGLALPNTGSFEWFVHNMPTADARVRVIAHDADGHATADTSDAAFAIVRTPGGVAPTTLRDFHMPGTQPFGAGGFSSQSTCNTCHSGYAPDVEPGFAFRGTMMGQAAHDPLFHACLAVAEQDAPSSGDMCIRCHAPMAWLTGKSQPTSGARIDALGREGLSCDFCHRLVDPLYKPGTSPVEDLEVLGGMLPSHVPIGYSNGQYVVDASTRRRGPFADALAPHEFLDSPFHRSSDLCGTCHDVSNPVYVRIGGARYTAGPFDAPAESIHVNTLMPLERTYSEWKHSAFPAGVVMPDFAGNAPGGIVSSCQDCHMRKVTGRGCNDASAPERSDLPTHDLTGGNAWMGGVIASLDPGETDAAALAAGRQRAVATLRKAATLDLAIAAEGDSFRATVRITNRSGHKLPTGYPEGRRMWLDVQARDAQGTLLWSSCAYDSTTGVLSPGPHARVYEAHLGISRVTGTALGLSPGESFHFTLNDTLLKDNRIPPLGFTNAAYEAFGGRPVDPAGPEPRYPDGQNWDDSGHPLPPGTATVTATLWYQTASKEYVEFLHAANVTNDAGQILLDAWAAHGRAAPVQMATVTLPVTTASAPDGARPRALELAPLRNPAHGVVELALALPRDAEVRFEVFDVSGRCVSRRALGRLAAGLHRVVWDGRDLAHGDAGAGTFWAVVRAGDRRLVRRVVRLR
jgi:glucose/arabinose dehydrogenase